MREAIILLVCGAVVTVVGLILVYHLGNPYDDGRR